eukprot:scaffold68822_cov39-Phaeocystis_antarctica.AAC.1
MAGDGAGSTSAAPAKKKTAYTSPYHVFCQEQRPLITPGRMTNAEREKHLGAPHARTLAPALALAQVWPEP